jgi:demethylmenaquinone methyltransferase/2-methoxy-6-polyprenyl-1,4-benzoquinol methylase
MGQERTNSKESQPYGWGVCLYDAADLPWRHQRVLAVAHLALHPGATVLDLGCGTGLSFAPLEALVHAEGQIIGIDHNAAMLARARERITHQGWHNVILLEANAEELALPPASVDALHCFYVHDIVMSRQAMERALRALRPGGSVVLAGPKQPTALPGRGIARLFSRAFTTDIIHTPRPWAAAEEVTGSLHVEEQLWGSTYLAWGMKS